MCEGLVVVRRWFGGGSRVIVVMSAGFDAAVCRASSVSES